MARRNPPRKVTYFEPVAPRLPRNAVYRRAAPTIGARLAITDG